ncbi:MAG TPA: regulatory protein GemA [Longimicrobium sp.]|jgi:phage gp16-like protein
MTQPHNQKTPSAPAPRDRRTAELGAIHACKRALRWDDETYRSALHELTEKTSAADLDAEERALVLNKMRELGAPRTGRSATWSAGRSSTDSPQVRKARELWIALGATGALRDPSDGALHSFCLRQVGRSRLEWCGPEQLVKVIEGLKAWLARVEANAGAGGEG